MRVRVSKIAKIHKNLQEETGISASRVLEILSRVSRPGTLRSALRSPLFPLVPHMAQYSSTIADPLNLKHQT